MRNTRYTEEFRLKMVRKYLRGTSAKELCAKYKIPSSTLQYWITKHRMICKYAGELISVNDYKELKAQNEKMLKQLEIYRITGCSPQSSEIEKLEAVKKQSKNYTVKFLCQSLCLDRAKYYRYIKNIETKNARRRKELTKHIIDIFNKNEGRYGSKRICATLKRMGYTTSPRLVSRLMKENNLIVKIGEKPSRPPQKYDNRHPNLLSWQKRYALSCPDVAWVSDVTEFKICGVKFYICTIQDIASRYILSYKISTRNNTQLAALTFEAANQIRPAPLSLLFHSDQGGIYTSLSFSSYLRAHGVTQSFSKKGTPHDNGHMESFFATLKKEEIYRRKYNTPEEFFESIEKYVQYYNNERLHSCLGYQTPKEALNYFDSTEESKFGNEAIFDIN